MKKSIFISLALIVAFITLNAQEQSKKSNARVSSKTELLKMKNIFDLLKATDPSADYSNYICRSFDLSISLSGVEYRETSAGGGFSQKQKDLISKISVGDKLNVEKIRVLEQWKHETHLLPDLILTLKE